MTEDPSQGAKVRQKHDPKERAQHALDLAERKCDRLQKRLDHLTDLQHATAIDLGAAQVERDYAKQHPLLREPEVQTVGDERQGGAKFIHGQDDPLTDPFA